MAARRLLIVMLILLGISTVAAALAPNRPQNGGATTAVTTQPAVPPPSPPAGLGSAALLSERIEVKPHHVTLIPGCSRAGQKTCLRAGDELLLDVSSKLPDQVEIPRLGEIQAVSRYAPAHFDLLLDQPGSYKVRLVDANRVVGVLKVSPAAQPGPSPKKASARRGRR